MSLARAAWLCLAMFWLTSAAAAASIKIIFPSALAPALETLIPDYERSTGGHVTLDHGGLGVIAGRVRDGEHFDVIISSAEQIDALAREGRIAAGSRTSVAKGAIGAGIRRDAPNVSIGTLETFRQTLLSAKSLAYVDPATGSAVGAWLTEVFQRLGIAADIRAKSILATSAAALFAAVKSGQAEIGLAQMSEITAERELALVGPLPPDIQKETLFSAAIAMTSEESVAAKGFIEFLVTRDATSVFRSKGLGM